MSSIEKRLAKLERGILAIVKDKTQRAAVELSSYVLDQMEFTKPKKRKDGSRRLPRNSGSRLRTLYGNLSRAVTPGEKGNVNQITFDGKAMRLRFGFDPTTKVQQGPRVGDLRYGALHEKGGTIKHPGGTAYRIIKGKARFVSNEKAAAYFGKTGKELPRTKPHSITMPKRPFLKPGIREYLKDPQGYQSLIDEMVSEVITLLKAK